MYAYTHTQTHTHTWEQEQGGRERKRESRKKRQEDRDRETEWWRERNHARTIIIKQNKIIINYICSLNKYKERDKSNEAKNIGKKVELDS